MQLSIGKRLFLGFGGVIAAIVISTIFTEVQLRLVRSSQDKVLNVRYPILLAGNQLSNGIDKSLAAVRGYMILGGEPQAAQKFKLQRSAAWRNIDDSITLFEQLRGNLDKDDLDNLDKIKVILPDIRKNQDSIEDIAHKPANQPALVLLINNAGPDARLMLNHLTAMIDLEGETESEEDRRELFKSLADSRGSFAISAGSLRAYLITGESVFKDRFDENWLINTDAYLLVDEEIDMLSSAQLVFWRKYEALRERFAPVSIKMFDLRLSKTWNIANHKLENDIEPDIYKITALLNEMTLQQKNKVSVEVDSLGEMLSQLELVTIVAAVFVTLAGLITGSQISIKIARSMEMLVKDAHNIAEGNLATEHCDAQHRASGDEIGLLASKFFQMSRSLSDMISTVKNDGTQMRIAAFQVASLSEEILSSTAQEQNNSSEVSDATDKLLAVSRTSLVLATEATTIVQSAKVQAEIGIDAVNETIAEMELSVNEVNQTVTGIEGLAEASQKIYNITDTIHNIAEQTNLLALNAAIEAARAGEHGRGFAVVADEVRNLADKTTLATVEINQLIQLLKSRVDESIGSMSRAANHVYASQKKSATCADAINSIGQSVTLINESSQDICAGTDLQMTQLGLLQDKLGQLFETLKEDSSRAGAVSIIAKVLYGVTENINKSLDSFVTLPNAITVDNRVNGRHLNKRITGCLRVVIYQEQGAVEGASRSFNGDHLGVDVSTPLVDDSDVVLTIFLPHKSFEEYKNQIPITMQGCIASSDFTDLVHQYSIKIDQSEQENLSLLHQAFDFFENNTTPTLV